MTARLLFAVLAAILAPTCADAGDVPKPSPDKKRPNVGREASGS
jgi:hypothetical protein